MLDEKEPRAPRPTEPRDHDKAAPTPSADGERESAADAADPDRHPSSGHLNGRIRERRSVAGRKGAQRIHELIQRGRQYEQEHGLKRGRQRLRQLIEEGKLYEQEHGLDQGETATQRTRTPRMSRHQVMVQLVEALIHLAQPGYRPGLRGLLESLTTTQTEATASSTPPEPVAQT